MARNLLNLPSELKLMVYESLLEDITADGQNYTAPSYPLPKYDFSSYLALIRTCKATYAEVTPLLRDSFWRATTWHFNSEHDLHQFDQIRRRTNLEGIRLTFCLHLRLTPLRDIPPPPSEEFQMYRSRNSFMARQMKQGRWSIPAPRLWRTLQFAMLSCTYPKGPWTQQHEQFAIHSERIEDVVHVRIAFQPGTSQSLVVNVRACLERCGRYLSFGSVLPVATFSGDLDAVDWTEFDVDMAKLNSSRVHNGHYVGCNHGVLDWP